MSTRIYGVQIIPKGAGELSEWKKQEWDFSDIARRVSVVMLLP